MTAPCCGRWRDRVVTQRGKIERGSGNVFLDVGFPPAEAENLLLRAQRMSKIRSATRGVAQKEAAKRFGVTQPRLNDLLRGKIEKISLDALVTLLSNAGVRVEFAGEEGGVMSARKRI